MIEEKIEGCDCFYCMPNTKFSIRFFACKCGNKRCPHGEYHGYRCNNSNEPNQVKEIIEGKTGNMSETEQEKELLQAALKAYDYFIQSIEDFKQNAPLKWKKWNYRRMKKKKSLRVKD